ncbi:hypothetical protein GW17_00040094 [Ensete ventricosum]|nr:hypothetical protein GW17_00040094 [Ensete ventricosum]
MVNSLINSFKNRKQDGIRLERYLKGFIVVGKDHFPPTSPWDLNSPDFLNRSTDACHQPKPERLDQVKKRNNYRTRLRKDCIDANKKKPIKNQNNRTRRKKKDGSRKRRDPDLAICDERRRDRLPGGREDGGEEEGSGQGHPRGASPSGSDGVVEGKARRSPPFFLDSKGRRGGLKSSVRPTCTDVFDMFVVGSIDLGGAYPMVTICTS